MRVGGLGERFAKPKLPAVYLGENKRKDLTSRSSICHSRRFSSGTNASLPSHFAPQAAVTPRARANDLGAGGDPARVPIGSATSLLTAP